jgi:hypothetical protein
MYGMHHKKEAGGSGQSGTSNNTGGSGQSGTSTPEPTPNEIIVVTTHIVKGSVWVPKESREIIQQQIDEALRIWRENVGINLTIKKPVVIEGPKRQEMGLLGVGPKELTKFANDLQAEARNIVVVFMNTSRKGSRAYTFHPLVMANTPVIIVGKEVFDKPDLSHKLDLAHELARVFLRDQTVGKPGNILAQDTNTGDEVTKEQQEKARKYPNNK